MLDERVVTEGYAWPPLVIAGTTGARSLSWLYPGLEGAYAHHFAGEVFGSLHDFSVVHESEDEVTLAFCPNGRGTGATIRGSIRLVPGEALLAADWRFETSGPDEGAGGAVTFAAYGEGPGLPPHLVAAEGYFYRYRSLNPPYPDMPKSYARFGARSIRWKIHATGERPCNTGLSYYLDPPTSPEGRRFHACLERSWSGR